MKEDYDVIVVGAGGVGVSTAIHLQNRNQSVLLLDKKGVADATSYGNAGIIDTSYIMPFKPPSLSKLPSILCGKVSSARMRFPSGLKYTPWILDYYRHSTPTELHASGTKIRPLIENAVQEHEDLLKDTEGARYLSRYGSLKLHRTEASFQKAEREYHMLSEYGVSFDILTSREIQDVEPHIRPIFFKGVFMKDSRRYTCPDKAIKSMADKFVKRGGVFEVEAVTRLQQENGMWQVNSHTAKHVVMCCGPWTNDVLQPLNYRFPIGIKRGYHMHYKAEVEVKRALVDVDNGYVIAPMEKGMRMTSGAEFAGLETPPNPVQIDQILSKAKEFLSIGDAVEDEAWMGARPCMADSLPVIGESQRHRGLWFNFGHGHVGITAGPASGKLLAQMITGETTFCNPDPYSYQRFSWL